MKEIQPISIWYNGQILQATLFNLTSTNDNLVDSAIFYYQLLTVDKIILSYGNLTMTGFDYEAYSTSPDSNSYAYQWGATQLNLTLSVEIFKVEMPTNELINNIPITLSNI